MSDNDAALHVLRLIARWVDEQTNALLDCEEDNDIIEGQIMAYSTVTRQLVSAWDSLDD